jgi:transcriptional regulator with XRE-family HTH domain
MSDGQGWYGPDAATFGDRVAGAREAAAMSRAELAKRLGVKTATLAGWEDDLSEPRANKLTMMAGLLNVSITWLLTGEGDGASAPIEAEATEADYAAILAEIRSLQADLRAGADRAGRLEKRLRRIAARDMV